jgi:sugar phosphate isomerase/epimerase
VLVYGYFLNDPDWGPATRGPLVHAMLDPGWGHVESSRGRYSLGARPVTGLRTLAAVKRALEARRVTDATLGWYRALHEPDRWAATGERIVSMQRHAERRKVRFVLLILPLIWRLDGEYPLRDVHQRSAAFARGRGIEVVDALPALRGRADAELIVHPRDRHPNGEYSRIVAETLAQTLRDPPEATWMRMRVTAPGAG